MKEQPSGLESGSPGSRVEIHDEHVALRDTLGKMERTSDLSVLLPMLRDLRTRIEVHFAREEAPSGFHEIIGESAPHLLSYLQRLFEEHRELVTDLEALTEKARICLEGPVADVLKDMAAFSQRIQVHEARETSLLGDAMYTDLGESS